MKLSETYSNKVNSCINSISCLGYDISDIIKKYEGQYFPNGPEKSACFSQVVSEELSKETYDYLQKMCNLTHYRDSRTPQEYGIDLILGWLIEDTILSLLKEKGKKAILSGYDRFREFLPARKISTQPDIRVQFNCGERFLEVFSDLKGTWRNKNHADLRDNKYNKLKEEEAVMIGIASTTSEGFLIDFAKDEGFEESFIPAYHKTGYTYFGVRSILRPLNEVAEDLLSL